MAHFSPILRWFQYNMSEEKSVRLSAVLRQINTSREDVVNFLSKQGFTVDNNPNAKISADAEALVVREFASSAKEKACLLYTSDAADE